MLDRAMIIVNLLLRVLKSRVLKSLPVIGWLIRIAIWMKDGVEYLLDERKDRQRYGKPLRFWMVWRKLGREMTVAIREGAEKERNRKRGRERNRKERGRGWVRGVQWIDKGVRGAEDRREMWLHDGRGDRVEEKVDDRRKRSEDWNADGREQVAEERVGIDWGMEKPEIVIMSTGLNAVLTDEDIAEADRRLAESKTYVKEFMEGYGKDKGRRITVARGHGKTEADRRDRELMELQGYQIVDIPGVGWKAIETSKTYGKRMG